jgi:histone-lysine N-methyltransferase SETMAR
MRAMRKRRVTKIADTIFHHDNAPSHRAAETQYTIRKLGFEVPEHPAYSPDLAPCDFFLFPTLKNVLRGEHFDGVDELSYAVQGAISEINNGSYFNSFMSWINRCKQCVSFHGEYFEKD